MESKKPDNVVFSEEEGYNASLLSYSTSVGAPVIKMDDVVSWKSRGISNHRLPKTIHLAQKNGKKFGTKSSIVVINAE